MSRTIDSGLLTALTQHTIQPFFAVELLFDSGAVRLWSGIGDRDINGNTYTGTGSLLDIGPADEVNDLSAKSMAVTLTGLDSGIVSLAIQEPYQRRKANIYLGEQSETSVVQIFSGPMNTMNIEDSGEQATVQLTIESNLVELERAANWRYTNENHQSRYDGDTFFSFVQAIQDQKIAWGRKSA